MCKKCLIGLVLVVGAGLLIVNYLKLHKKNIAQGKRIVIQENQTANDVTKEVPYTLEAYARGLFVPWSIVFTSKNRLLVTERNGNIRVIENNVLQQKPLLTFDESSNKSEEGLMGMTLHPQYTQNKRLYVCLAYEKNDSLFDKVVELKDEGKSISITRIILDEIPAAQFHAGCRIKFGPDNKLYITTGDATEKNIAQDKSSLGGKILRINDDGSVPSDNPFPKSLIWSLGHRNPQGLDWHPITKQLVVTEHGPSGFDGPGGGDEVNVIVKGGNYGWPIVSHEKSQDGLISPLLVFTPAEAPASGMFYKGSAFPQFTNNFFFGVLKGEGIIRVILDEADVNKVVSYEKIVGVSVGRVREIVESPDGDIYFTSSNRDGRGTTLEGDDKIYRIHP